VRKAGQAHGLKRKRDILPDLRARQAPHAQRERDVVVNGEMGEQRVILKHHPNIAMIHRQVGGELAVDPDIARIGNDEAGDGHEQRCLTRPGRP
jgi:hypothetical protein